MSISVNYDAKANKFLIKCGPEFNALVMGLPDRRFRKGSRVWAAPALRRNVMYMAKHINNPQMFSQEALAIFNVRRAELQEKPKGENKFPVWYDFKNSPMPHQNDALHKYFPLNEAGIFFEQGLGKTFTSINLAAAWRMTDQIDAVVVICPSSIKLVWQEELDKHCPIDTQRHVLTSGKYKAADKFIGEKTDFQWLMVGIEGLSQGKAYEYVNKFMSGRRVAIILDESSGIKTPGKTRTDRCIAFGKMAVKRVILSGTSITQGIEDLYTQFQFLNPNIIGYESFYSFRAQYCVTMSIEVQEDKWVQKIVGYKNEGELMSLIKPFATRVEKIDVPDLNLPPKTFTNRCIPMNPTQKRLYAEMRDELTITAAGVEGEIDLDSIEPSYEAVSVLEQSLRLQQITGGHYPWNTGEKIVPEPIPGVNPKIKELMSIIEQISGKLIIWCQFRPEIELVANALRGKGVSFVEFHGGCDDTEKKFAVHAIQKDPTVKVFLATRAAAYGLTLTEASTAVYYSQGYSLEQYAQSQDRIHRIGQDDHCNYIHLVCDKTIDIKIIRALADKKSVADLIYSLVKE
jgi:SNF2 family DNA or RNA helicase